MLLDCLGKLAGKFPKLKSNAENTMVFSHNSASFQPFVLGDKSIATSDGGSQVTDAPADNTNYHKQFDINGQRMTLSDILRVLHAAPKTSREYTMVQDYIANSDETELQDLKSRLSHVPSMKQTRWGGYWKGAKPWAATSEATSTL